MKYIEILARNVFIDPEKEAPFFDKLVEKAQGNQFIEKYIKRTLKTYITNEFPGTIITKVPSNAPDWLINKVKEGEEVYNVSFNARQRSTMEHWIDYLVSLDIKKDIRMSVPDLIKQVKEWDKSFKVDKAEKEDFKGIETIHTFDDGYKWVKVLSESALKREGTLMNNCIGKLYIEPVKEGRCEIYSLRDPKNKPHISVEFDLREKEIAQIKGYANGAVAPKYVPKMQYFLDKKLVKYNSINEYELIRSDMMIKDGKLVQFSTLDSYTGDSLDLDGTLIPSLPKKLELTGELILNGSKITSIEGSIKASSISASESNVTSISGTIICTTDVDFSYSKLEVCNANIEANKLNLSNNKKLKSISGKYLIDEDFDISDTPITQIEGTLKVGDFCDLSFTKIQSLPKDFKTDRLNLAKTNIKELPEGLKIRSMLYLFGSKIRKLPKNLEVPLLNIKHTQIKEIPSTIKVQQIVISTDMKKALKCSEEHKKLIKVG